LNPHPTRGDPRGLGGRVSHGHRGRIGRRTASGGHVVFSLAAVDGVRIVGCVGFSECRAISRAGARAGRRAARATATRRRQSLDSRRFGSLRSWRLGGGFRSRQSRLLRPLRISRGSRERVRIALRRPAFHGAGVGARRVAGKQRQAGVCLRLRRAGIVRPACPTKLCRHSWTDSRKGGT
jgi:hypothetical protein